MLADTSSRTGRIPAPGGHPPRTPDPPPKRARGASYLRAVQPSDLRFLQELQERSFEQASAATNSSYPPERRMDAGGLSVYLEERRYLMVSTVRRSGKPHVALSAFVFQGERFWMPTMEGTARARNLAHRPYASLAVADGDGADHKAILAEGPVTLVPTPEPAAITAWEARDGKLPEWADTWIELRPQKLFSYDAGAPEPLIGWRCEACGDAFTSHSVDDQRCPSCGSHRTSHATEPFL